MRSDRKDVLVICIMASRWKGGLFMYGIGIDIGIGFDHLICLYRERNVTEGRAIPSPSSTLLNLAVLNTCWLDMQEWH